MGMTKTLQWQQKERKDKWVQTQDGKASLRNRPAKGRAKGKYNFAEYSAFKILENLNNVVLKSFNRSCIELNEYTCNVPNILWHLETHRKKKQRVSLQHC